MIFIVVSISLIFKHFHSWNISVVTLAKDVVKSNDDNDGKSQQFGWCNDNLYPCDPFDIAAVDHYNQTCQT